MNTKSKDGKKRIAHVGSSSSNTTENAEMHQNDYLASILERMDSNDKQIVSYEQLNDYRKSKYKPVLLDVDMTQPVESSGSFKLKKKPGPLMAKCQRNLKYIKHNRRIPKPRAHVGFLSKETQSVKLSLELKKNIDSKIKPKKVQKNSFELSSEKPSKSLSLQTKAKKPVSSVVNKPNEEWNDTILESQNGTETNNSTISKQSESELRLPVETNSSEESDNFESFIRQQVVSENTLNHKKTSVKKRKNVQKRKVFKRIKYGSASSSESDSDNEEESFSKTGLNKSCEANKLKKSKELEEVNNSDDGSIENFFDFDNACNDSSDDCEENETLCKAPLVDNLLNKDNKTVEQSVDILSNYDLSDSCISSSNAANCSPQLSLSNKELNLSEISFSVDQVSAHKQDLSESKNASEQDLAGGYESDDCVILDNSPPEFNIKISAVKSVAMLPTTDEDESAEAVLEFNNPQKIVIDETNKIECIKMDSDIQTATLNQQALMNSLASSEKPKDALSEENVWEALKSIDFEKLKSLPQLSNSLLKEKIKSEELSHVFIADQNQSSSSLPQEKPCIAYPESYSQNSTSSKKYGDVEVIDLSGGEDTSQNEIVGSTNQNLDFISKTVPTDATFESTSTTGHKDSFISSKYFNFEVKAGDVSSSGVLDENDLNFHKSLMSHNTFEPSCVNIPVVKKEAPSTSDELDISSASSLQTLYSAYESDVSKLLDLYHKEYQQYKEIEKTGLNLSDGLSLLLNRQVDKLVHIKTSIKNIIKHDPCFLKVSKKVKPELKPINCGAIVKKEQDWEKKTKPSSKVCENPQFSDREHPELSIYTESVLQGIQKVVGNSLPPESTLRAEKVKEQLTNIKCAQCGRTASAACQGCFKVFYCSTECGMSDWEKGHSFSCGT